MDTQHRNLVYGKNTLIRICEAEDNWIRICEADSLHMNLWTEGFCGRATIIYVHCSSSLSDSAGLGRSQVGGFHYEPPCDFKGHPSKVMLRTLRASVTHPAPSTESSPLFPFIHFDAIPYTSVELSAMGDVSWEQELNENQGVLSTDHPSMVVVHLWVGGSLWLNH